MLQILNKMNKKYAKVQLRAAFMVMENQQKLLQIQTKNHLKDKRTKTL